VIIVPEEPTEGGASDRRRILFLTGTRADFGKLKPLIQQVAASEDFEYRIFATGMHMLARYGSTILEIEKAGFSYIYPFINHESDGPAHMDLTLATSIMGLSRYVREFPPDLIVVHGDRVETLAGAIVGSLNNILVAHVEGGELSGTVDELIRHAVTKLSHLHFVANDEARCRLIQMGEVDESIFVIGSPDIDIMLSSTLPSLEEVREYYDIPYEAYGVFVYHPVTTELPHLETRFEQVMDGVERSGREFVVIYPNNDAGSEVIMAGLERWHEHPRFRTIPSMRFEYFLTLLKHADAMVGNSSAGVREAPVYGVPTVNIGTRQHSRFSWPTILDVPEDAEAIEAALRSLPVDREPSLYFGAGRSAKLFADALRTPTFWNTPRGKQFQDLPAVT
jgi:UDP-N-acetylglucosamine 2-epimerase (hydrolysing)